VIQPSPIDIHLTFEHRDELRDLYDSLRCWQPHDGWSPAANKFFKCIKEAIDEDEI